MEELLFNHRGHMDAAPEACSTCPAETVDAGDVRSALKQRCSNNAAPSCLDVSPLW